MSLLDEVWRGARRCARQAQRMVRDKIDGRDSQLVGPNDDVPTGPLVRSVFCKQPIRNSEGEAAKRHNIELAAGIISRCAIHPAQIFSFWHVVGRPTRSRGFRAGRSIVDGELVRDLGGGLCQLAGILHVLAMRSGMTIIERHAHSRDIYTEATRYTPLGSDAAVAFAYKDLRFRNTLPYPVRLEIELDADAVHGHILSPNPLTAYTLDYTRHDGTLQRYAATYRTCPTSQLRELVHLSRYTLG